MFDYRIQKLSPDCVEASAVQLLLTDVYVGEGHTRPELAERLFVPTSVFGRGDVFGAIDNRTRQLVGIVVLANSDSTARKFADADGAELHLLAVSDQHRRQGVGSALIRHVLEQAQSRGFSSMVLWTQPQMKSAHRLYSWHGFQRDESNDFTSEGREFWVYRVDLGDGVVE